MHNCQGDDVVHDAIRQQQVEAGVPLLTAAALARYEGQHEEVLWAALFSLAVLIREGSNPYILSAEAAVQAGLLPLLQSAVKDYEVNGTCWTVVPQHHIVLLSSAYTCVTLTLHHALHWDEIYDLYTHGIGHTSAVISPWLFCPDHSGSSALLQSCGVVHTSTFGNMFSPLFLDLSMCCCTSAMSAQSPSRQCCLGAVTCHPLQTRFDFRHDVLHCLHSP